MIIWQQAYSEAREMLKSSASMLLDKYCPELFEIDYVLSDLAAEADQEKSYSVACGLYAAAYRLAGTVKNIANAAEIVATVVDKHKANCKSIPSIGGRNKFRFSVPSNDYQPLLEKIEDYQSAIEDFARLLKDDCHRELIHLVSELGVLTEHPSVARNDSFLYRLQGQKERVEAYSELLYELSSQLEKHPILIIDPTISDRAIH